MYEPEMGPNSSPGAAGLGGLSPGATPAARASPPDWRRKGGGGGSLGQWDWGSENAGMKAIRLLYNIHRCNLFLTRLEDISVVRLYRLPCSS